MDAPPAASGAPRPCTVLWHYNVGDLVSYGFGASVKQLEFMRIWAARHGCDMPVGESFAEEWSSWELGPFWDRTVPDAEWSQRWSQAQACGYLNRQLVRCQATEASLVNVDWDFEDVTCEPEYLGNLLQTFGRRFAAYRAPFSRPYAGMHIRHGDKALEGRIYSFQAHMGQLTAGWPDVRRVFVATDDATVISERVAHYRAEGYNLTWTADEKRWAGGSPQTAPAYHPGHHANGTGAISALLKDVAGLARAAVLVGSFNSNFFRLAWLLNTGLHASEHRQAWCHDLYTGLQCNDLREQVMAFCRDLPRMEERCGSGAAAPA